MKNLKKTLAVISSAVMLCCGVTPSFASAEEYTVIKDKYTAEEALAAGYDFNLDGIVSYSDSYTLLQYCSYVNLGDENPDFIITDYIDSAIVEAVETYGDLTGNGIVDLIDTTVFLSECNSIIRNGDIDEDGVLEIEDAISILNHYCEVSNGNKEYMNSQEYMFTNNIGDINHDGDVNPVDATQVLQVWALNSMS